MTANTNLLEIARSSSLHSAPMAHGLEQQGSKQGENCTGRAPASMPLPCACGPSTCSSKQDASRRLHYFIMALHFMLISTISVAVFRLARPCHKLLREHRFPQTLVSVDALGHKARRSQAVPCDVQQARWSCSPASLISFSYMMP